MLFDWCLWNSLLNFKCLNLRNYATFDLWFVSNFRQLHSFKINWGRLDVGLKSKAYVWQLWPVIVFWGSNIISHWQKLREHLFGRWWVFNFLYKLRQKTFLLLDHWTRSLLSLLQYLQLDASFLGLGEAIVVSFIVDVEFDLWGIYIGFQLLGRAQYWVVLHLAF